MLGTQAEASCGDGASLERERERGDCVQQMDDDRASLAVSIGATCMKAEETDPKLSRGDDHESLGFLQSFSLSHLFPPCTTWQPLPLSLLSPCLSPLPLMTPCLGPLPAAHARPPPTSPPLPPCVVIARLPGKTVELHSLPKLLLPLEELRSPALETLAGV